MFHALAVAVKRRDSRGARLAYRVAKRVIRMELPAPRLPFRALFYLHQTTLNLWRYLASKLFYQPMFRARCESCGPGLILHLCLPYIYGDLRLRVGSDCKINGRSSLVAGSLFDGPSLTLGDHTNIGYGVVISVSKSVTLGNHVRVADGCVISDNPGHPLDPVKRRSNLPVDRDSVRPIVIEDDVWLGGGVRVMPGVTIGHGSVIGAGSVVTKDIPPLSVAVGSPARVVRKVAAQVRQVRHGLVEAKGST